MKKSIVWIFAGIILFSGCNITSVGKTTPTISAQQIQQWAKQTIEAMGQTNATSSSVVSILPQASPTTRPILIQPTLAPTAIPTIRSVVIPTISYVQPVQKACDRMRFIADVTIEDNTVLSPNQAFRKTWRIQNSGSCTWSPGYRLIFDSGDPMSGPASVNIPQYVSPDQTIDISVDLRAPAANGIYQGNWMMQNASGMKFGTSDTVNQGIWVKIIVGSENPATPVYPGLPSGGNCSIIASSRLLKLDSPLVRSWISPGRFATIPASPGRLRILTLHLSAERTCSNGKRRHAAICLMTSSPEIRSPS